MSFENDSADYRAFDNFENSSINKSDNRQAEPDRSLVIDSRLKNLTQSGVIPQSESDSVVPTYANELERRQLEQSIQSRELRSDNNYHDRRQELLTTAPPRATNSIPLPSSTEMMRKSLDKFG